MERLLTFSTEPWRGQMYYPLFSTKCFLFLRSELAEHSRIEQLPTRGAWGTATSMPIEEIAKSARHF